MKVDYQMDRQTEGWTDNASRDAGVLPCFTCTEDTTGRHLCLWITKP